MSQTYDPLKPISGLPGVGTPFSGLYQIIRDHIAAAISQFSGTAFPASPVAGQKCYRTDRLTVSGYPKCYTYTGNGALGESGWVEDAVGTALGEEVINSRGSKSSLDQRLDVAMNEDGTLKAATSLNPSQWQDMTGHTFTYLTSTSFKIDGDQTDIYKNLRRLKVNLAASMAYSEVVSSSFSAGPNETTVQILDAVLDATLVDVEHSLFLPDKDSGALSSRMTGRRRVKSIAFADSPYTTTIHDEIILVDASGGVVLINVLAAATLGAGRRQEVIKIDNTTNAVTIDPNAAETINGNATYGISVPLTGIEYESDGSNLRTINDSADKLSAGDIVQDFVVSGLLGVDPGASLTMTIPAGVAYVLGRRVVKLAGAADLTRTYTASKDTYVDISHTGAITYTEVTNGAWPPSIALNSIRLQKVITNGTEITSVTDLRTMPVNSMVPLLLADMGSFLTASLPSSQTWYGIAYGNGRFVAVSSGTASAYSIDGGATWIAGGALPSSTGWLKVVYGNGRFVAVSGVGTASAYSTDGGVTWVAGGALPSSQSWYGIAYGNGRFVAVGGVGTSSAYSADGGVTWTAGGALPSSQTWYGVAYGNGRFVAVSGLGTASAYSADGGATWIAGGALPSSQSWYDIVYGNGRFVAVSGTSTAAAYSTDGGATWVASTLPAYQIWRSVTYGNGRFITIGSSGSSAYSTDGGATWKTSILPSSQTWRGIAYGNSRFAAVSGTPSTAALYVITTLSLP